VDRDGENSTKDVVTQPVTEFLPLGVIARVVIIFSIIVHRFINTICVFTIPSLAPQQAASLRNLGSLAHH
jgi:hypothetical protein